MRDVTPAVSPRLAAMVAQARGQADVTLTQDPRHWTDAVDTDAAVPGSAHWEAGVEAFAQGLPREACPYDQDMEAAADWLAAWDGARRAAE